MFYFHYTPILAIHIDELRFYVDNHSDVYMQIRRTTFGILPWYSAV